MNTNRIFRVFSYFSFIILIGAVSTGFLYYLSPESISSSSEQNIGNANISLGAKVDSYEFGATLYNSTHSGVEEMMDAIKEKHKGKTLILDLWGSSCGPCLRDFKNSSDIKKELKENNVEVVYLCAGRSSTPEKWKKVIVDNKLVGDHIYMDRKMTTEYMKKFNFKRYPGYLVVDKDGNYNRNLVNRIANIKVDKFLANL